MTYLRYSERPQALVPEVALAPAGGVSVTANRTGGRRSRRRLPKKFSRRVGRQAPNERAACFAGRRHDRIPRMSAARKFRICERCGEKVRYGQLIHICIAPPSGEAVSSAKGTERA